MRKKPGTAYCGGIQNMVSEGAKHINVTSFVKREVALTGEPIERLDVDTTELKHAHS